MIRRLMIAVIMLLFLSILPATALGIGVQGGFNAGPNSTGDVAITFKLAKIPFVFAGNIAFDSSKVGFGLSADNWVLNNTFIQAPFNWYIGWGLYTNMVFGDPFGISFGARLPLGINAFFLNGFVETYIQIAPSFGITFLPSLKFPDWFIPLNIGVRLWLKKDYSGANKSVK